MPTTPGPSHNPRGGPDSKYSLSGKAAEAFSSDAVLNEAHAPGHSKGLAKHGAPTKKKEALTFYLPLLLTGGDMAKWWELNRYTWSEYVDRRDAQEAEVRELFDDMTNDGWFSD